MFDWVLHPSQDLSTSFPGTFYKLLKKELNFVRKKIRELRKEFSKIFGETSWSKLSLLPPKRSLYNLRNLINPLRANFTKWSNTIKQFVSNLPTNCLSVFDHFEELALKGLIRKIK